MMNHNRMKYRFHALCLLLLFTVLGSAQGSFYSTTNAKKYIVGSTIEYRIIVDNIRSVSNVTAPNFGRLKLISGPMQSSSTTISNGVRSSQQSLVYTLIASSAGKFTIPGASGIINEKKAYTKPLDIEIVANRKGIFITQNRLFIKMIPSDSIVYIGQQLTINYVLYTQISVEAANVLKESAYNGFYKEDNVRFSRANGIEEIDGIQYHTSMLKQVCLYPQQTGYYDIEHAIFKIGTAKPNQTRRNRGFFFRNTLNYQNLITNDLSIRVKDVPRPSPNDYIGGVGRFSIQAQVDRKQIQNNKAFNLIVLIEGDGDPKMFTPPVLNLDENLDVYEPILQEEKKQEKDNKKIFSRRYQYTIVPKKQGNYNISAHCSYFNPDSTRFEKISKGPFQIRVLQGRAIEQIVEDKPMMEQKPIWVIHSIKQPIRINESVGFNGFLLLSLLILLGMIGTKIYTIKTSDERAATIRKKSIHASVMKRLADAKSYMDKEDLKGFHNEIFKALQKYLSNKYEIEIGDVTTTKIIDELGKYNIEAKTIDDISILLDESQMAIFGGMSQRSMVESFEILVGVIENLENSKKESN